MKVPLSGGAAPVVKSVYACLSGADYSSACRPVAWNAKVNPLLMALRSFGRASRASDRDRDALLRRIPRGAVCAEIGVWKGQFSEVILRRTTPAELHLIDPWLFQSEYPNRMYGGSVAKSQQDMDRIYEDVAAMFHGDSRVRIHRSKSEEALGSFPDGYFDWVYIDGNHYFEHVLLDLELSTRKVRGGGFVAGDDYLWRDGDDQPVKRAVNRFSDAGKLDVEIIGNQYLIRTPIRGE